MPKAPGKKAPAKAAPSSTLAQPVLVPDTADEPAGDDLGFVSLEDTEEFANTLYYGREGSGKSTASVRMANLPHPDGSGREHPGKVLVINAEGGLKKRPLVKRGVNISKIVVFPDPKKGQEITFKALDAVYRKIKADLQRDPLTWIGVVFDSETEITQVLLDQVQIKRVNQIRAKGAEVDEHFVDISDYGTMTKMARDLLRKYRDLPCHFAVTALERRDVDKQTGKAQYGPAVTPGLAKDLLGYVDFVLMCKSADEGGPFRALTRANNLYRAKDRFDVTPKVMTDPYFDRLVAYLTEQITEDTDPLQAQADASSEDVKPGETADDDGDVEAPEDGSETAA